MNPRFVVQASACKAPKSGRPYGCRRPAATRALPTKVGTTNLCGYVGAFLFLFALHPNVHACAVCFGKSDSAMAKGMNMGIFTLLLCITGVLATLATFFVFLAVRSSRHPHRDAIVASLNSPENPAHS